MSVLAIGLRLLSFARIRSCLHWWARPRPRTRRFPAEKIAWAVRATAARLPETTCLIEAVAAHALLGRSGHDATLKIGVRGRDGTLIDAHAWVEHGDAVLIGTTADLHEYGVLSLPSPVDR